MADAKDIMNVNPDDEKLIIHVHDLQKQINATIEKRKKIYQEIGTDQLNVEAELLASSREQEKHLQLAKDLQKDLATATKAFALAKGDEERKRTRDAMTSVQANIQAELLSVAVHRANYDEIEYAAKQNFENETKHRNLIGKLLQNNFGIQVKEISAAKALGDELSQHLIGLTKSAYWIGAIVMMLTHAWKLFNQLDKSAATFRKEMGMTRDNAKGVRAQAERMAIDFMHVGVTIDAAYTAIKALGTEMGSVLGISKELATTTALLASQYGISEEDSAGTMRNLSVIGKTTMEAQQNTVLFAASLSQAAGVPLPLVMKDVAKLSSVALTMVSKMPIAIIKTAIEARRLNTSIDSMSNASKSLLNFSQSIQDEMEASVLVGKDINLQKARELAYQGKIAESTNEILDIADRIDFSNLDTFQMDAFAKASGRSVEELTKMIAARKQQQEIEKSTDPEIIKMRDHLKQIQNASKETLMTEVEKQKIFLKQESNQARLAAISQNWQQLLAKASEVMLPIIDITLKVLNNMIPMLPLAMGLTGAIGKFFSLSSSGVGPLSKIFSLLGKSLGMFSKFLGPIGWVIMAFQAISGFMRGWKTGGLLGGLRGAFESAIPFGATILKFFGFIWDKAKAILEPIWKISKFIFMWLTPLGWVMRFIGFIYRNWEEVSKVVYPLTRVFFKMWYHLSGMSTLVKIMTWAWNKLVEIVKPFLPYIEMLWKATKLFFSDMWAGLVAVWDKLKEWWNIGSGIVDGLNAMSDDIFKALLSPFKEGWEWLKAVLVGQSPSTLGLGILEGIVSVGSAIFDALTGPFRQGLAWIADKIPGMGKVAEKLKGGMSDIVNPKSVEGKATAAYVNAAKVTPDGVKLAGQPDTTKPLATVKQETAGASPMSEETGQQIVSLLKGLREDLTNGKVVTHMDGQLLSATLARQTNFHGGFGVNKV